jgi:formate dehydrogenase major subunit
MGQFSTVPRDSTSIASWILHSKQFTRVMVYANFHFPEASANELTIAVLDPVSKILEYKVCAVKVEAV